MSAWFASARLVALDCKSHGRIQILLGLCMSGSFTQMGSARRGTGDKCKPKRLGEGGQTNLVADINCHLKVNDETNSLLLLGLVL